MPVKTKKFTGCSNIVVQESTKCTKFSKTATIKMHVSAIHTHEIIIFKKNWMQSTYLCRNKKYIYMQNSMML